MVLPLHYAIDHRLAMTMAITPAPLRRDTHSHGPFAKRVSPDLCESASRWHVTFDPSFSTVIPDVIVLLTSIVAESSTPPFFCHSFSWALLQLPASGSFAASAFPVKCPRKMGQKKEKNHVLLIC